VQKAINEGDANLQKEIKGVELQIKQVEVNLHQAMAAQTRWLLGGLAVLSAVFKLADLLVGPLRVSRARLGRDQDRHPNATTDSSRLVRGPAQRLVPLRRGLYP